jgi:hypothetical protein
MGGAAGLGLLWGGRIGERESRRILGSRQLGRRGEKAVGRRGRRGESTASE